MAVVWLGGAEQGMSSASGGGLQLSTPSSSNASVVSTAGRVKSGTYSHRLNNGGPSTIAVRGFFNLAAAGVCNGGFWMLLEDLPSADRQLFTVQGATTEDAVIQYDQGTGKLAAYDPTNGQQGIWNSCPVLSADTWYWIAWKVDRTNAQMALTITPDGGSATDCGTINGASWTANNGWVGIGLDIAQGAFDAYYDDIIICSGGTEYPLGPHEILALRPGSDGTHNVAGTEYIDGDTATTPNFTNSTTDAWTRLDDDPWSTTRKTTGNISCEVHSAGTYLEIAPAAAPSGKPNALAVRTVLAYSSVTATANNGSATVIRNSTPTENAIRGDFTTGADYSESTNFFNGVMVTAPGAGWSKTEIDALRWRIGRASNSSDISPRPTWQELMLEVAYPIAAGGNTYTKANAGILDAVGSGSDVSAFTESGAGITARSASALDALLAVESGAGIMGHAGSGSAAKAGITYTKAGSGIINLAASGPDACTFSESGTVVSPRSASGVDATAFTEAGTGISARSASGVKAVIFGETGNGVLDHAGSGSATKTGGATYDKTGQGISARSASGSDAVTFGESGTGITNFSGSGSETSASGVVYTKSGQGIMVFTANGARARELVRSGSGATFRSASGAKAVVYGESGSGQAVFMGAGTRQVIRSRAGTGVLDFSGGGVTDKAVPVTQFFGRPSPNALTDFGHMTALVFGQPSPEGVEV